MRNFAVKGPYHLVFQALGFSRVFRGHHFLAESSEFFARELAGCKFESREIAHFLAFLGRKTRDLLTVKTVTQNHGLPGHTGLNSGLTETRLYSARSY